MYHYFHITESNCDYIPYHWNVCYLSVFLWFSVLLLPLKELPLAFLVRQVWCYWTPSAFGKFWESHYSHFVSEGQLWEFLVNSYFLWAFECDRILPWPEKFLLRNSPVVLLMGVGVGFPLYVTSLFSLDALKILWFIFNQRQKLFPCIWLLTIFLL